MWCYISDQTSFLLGKKLISLIVFQPNKMKWSLIGRISFHLLAYKSFQRLSISFENVSNQTYERKYLQSFQSKLMSKLMISVNFSNQTSFQLFHWNEIRETKFDWKFFHSNLFDWKNLRIFSGKKGWCFGAFVAWFEVSITMLRGIIHLYLVLGSMANSIGLSYRMK